MSEVSRLLASEEIRSETNQNYMRHPADNTELKRHSSNRDKFRLFNNSQS